MFNYLNETDKINLKKKISFWLRQFLIEPAHKAPNINEDEYLNAYDRRTAAQMCYDYLLVSGELKEKLLEVDKRKLVNDIAKYIDLRTPFIYYKFIEGVEEYNISKQSLNQFTFKYKTNERNAERTLYESKRGLLLKNKENWINLKPSSAQLKLITRELKRRKRKLTIEIEEMNKYQAHLLIPFLLEKQNYDEEEIKMLIK